MTPIQKQASIAMNAMNHPSTMDRRTFLRGVGVSLALPFMESRAWAAGNDSAKPPVR